MLPFLKKKDSGGIAQMIMAKRQPDGSIERDSSEQDKDSDGLESAAQDIIQAVESKDHKALASAIRAAFQIVDSEPHEEGFHPSDMLEHLK